MAGTKSYFRLEKFALRMCGISFREHESRLYKILSKILLPILALYPILAAADLFKHDFETVADSLTYDSPLFVGVFKIVTAVINRKKIAKLLNKVDTDPNLTKFSTGHGKQLMKRCVFVTTMQTSAYWMCTFLSYTLAVTYSLSTRIRSNDYHDWQLPYGVFTLLNITHSPNFEISWLYQCMSCGCIAVHFTTIDVLIAAVLCHVCFHLRILQSNLRRIVENTYQKMETVNKLSMSASKETVNSNDAGNATLEWKNLNASLKAMVDYHLTIIDIIKEVNESFSVLLLLIFLGTLGILSFMVFNASVMPLTDVRMLRSVGELSIGIFQVLVVCFWSEQMLFEGQEVGTAAYGASFVGTDLRFQKSLALVIRRSQTPIRLTAGFVDVSLATFTWILRSTYSAYMVLRKSNV